MTRHRRLPAASSAPFVLFAALVLICAASLFPATSEAALSASGAFTLIQKVPPGCDLDEAMGFLGKHLSERTVDEKGKIRLRRWGGDTDSWNIELLHDGNLVRGTRIVWRTATKRDQQMIFSQLTTAGKQLFGRTASFSGLDQAEWMEFENKLLIRARIEPEIAHGVTLLAGIRNDEKESMKYGF